MFSSRLDSSPFLLFFPPYFIKPGLILHCCFRPTQLISSFHPSTVSGLPDQINKSSRKQICCFSVVFITLQLFLASELLLRHTECSVTSLHWSRLRLQYSRCGWCKAMQKPTGQLLCFVRRGTSIRLSHYGRLRESIYTRLLQSVQQ